MLKKNITLILLALVLAASAFTQEKDDKPHQFGLAAKDWKLEVTLPEWNVKGVRISEDGQSTRLDAAIEHKGYLLTILMLTTKAEGTSTDLREFAKKLLARSPVKNEGITFAEYKEIPTLKYLVKEFQGVQLNQKHYNGYIAKDGVWIDIHLSKADYESGDEDKFFAILDSVKFVDNEKKKEKN